MIKSASEMEKDIREKMRGGEGSVEITNLFAPSELKGKTRLCAKIVLKENCSIGYHTHDNEEEIYYIISGKAIVDDNGVKKEAGPGDAVLTGDGAGHSIANAGSEPLVFMAVILLYE